MSSLIVHGFAVLLSSLLLLTSRQSRAFGVLENLDHVERKVALAEAEQTELRHTIQRLSRRTRISEVAQLRLDMRMPEASEIVLINGGLP